MADSASTNSDTAFSKMEEMFRNDFELNFSRSRDFLEEAGLSEGCHVLEIGCGFAYFLEHYKQIIGQNGSVTLVDPEEGFMAKVKPRLGENARFLIGTAESDGDEFRCRGNPAGYDLAVVGFVVNHLPDVKKAFNSIKDKLRPGGRIVIFDFIFNSHFYFSKAASRIGSVLLPDKNSATARCADTLAACGFTVQRVNNYVLQGKPGSQLWKTNSDTVSFMLQFAVSQGKITAEDRNEILTKELPAMSKDPDAVLFGDVMIQVAAEKPL